MDLVVVAMEHFRHPAETNSWRLTFRTAANLKFRIVSDHLHFRFMHNSRLQKSFGSLLDWHTLGSDRVVLVD